MQKKTGFSDDKSIGDENKDDEKKKDDDEWLCTSESSNDFSKLGTPVIRTQVQYLYHTLNRQ
jgi:hypothetical protein